MQANRYDRAAEAPILNTYVPINFGELYRIGAAQKEAVDQAAKDLTNTITTFGEFQSPSAVDTENYYRNSIGKFSDLIQEASTNPDAMKDANFRSRLQQRINNIDYGYLSRLKQSREGMLARQKANQQLMLSGKYNPLWHNVDFTNYDTAQDDIFNDISPLAYKSEVDLVKPYVDNLKASFIGVSNGWIHSGVSTDRTDYEIQKNLSSIQNTPEYRKHLEILQRQGLSKEDAEYQLNNTLITAGREFAYDQAERDPWWMESAKLQMKAAANRSAQAMNNLTTILHRDARKTLMDNFSGLTPDKVSVVMQKGVDALSPEDQAIYAANTNPAVMQARMRNSFNQIARNHKSLVAAENYLLDVMSSPLSPEVSDVYAKQGTNGTKAYGGYEANDTRNFILAEDFAYGLMGTTRSNVINPGGRNAKNLSDTTVKGMVARDKFKHNWQMGNKYHDFIIKGDPKVTTDGNFLYQRKYAYIPIEQMSDFTPEERAAMGMRKVKLGDTTTSTTDRQSSTSDGTSRTVSDKTREFIRVPILGLIPDEGESAITRDAAWTHDNRHLSSKTTDTQNLISEYERMN